MELINQSAGELFVGLKNNPACLILWLALNLLGVVLQQTNFWPNVWNKYIPLLLLMLGMALAPALIPVTILPPAQPNPRLLLAVLGFIFGVVAWLVHSYPLQWALKKFLPGVPADVVNNNNQNK